MRRQISLTLTGSEFHRVGAATKKARVPTICGITGNKQEARSELNLYIVRRVRVKTLP